MTISELLARHFERTEEAQAAFARRIGLTPQTVSQLVRGDIKVPTADIRRKLAKEFNLRHVDILVMVGELSSAEIEENPSPLPYDSERATAIALVPALSEPEAFVVRATIQAILKSRQASQVAEREDAVLSLA